MSIKRLFLLPTVALCSASSSHAITLSFSPNRDNVIFEDADGLSNGLGENLFAGENGSRGGNRELRSLITFDISSIPSGAIVNSVTLNLTANTPRRTNVTVSTSLHRLLGDWGEGSSTPSIGQGGNGATATSGDATWIHQFSPGDTWDTPGGDFILDPSAILDITENRLYSYESEQLASDVQGFIDGDFNNFGWILIAENGADAKRFSSGQSSNSQAIPELIIDFTPIPEPSTSALLAALIIPTLLRRQRTKHT